MDLNASVSTGHVEVLQADVRIPATCEGVVRFEDEHGLFCFGELTLKEDTTASKHTWPIVNNAAVIYLITDIGHTIEYWPAGHTHHTAHTTASRDSCRRRRQYNRDCRSWNWRVPQGNGSMVERSAGKKAKSKP